MRKGRTCLQAGQHVRWPMSMPCEKDTLRLGHVSMNRCNCVIALLKCHTRLRDLQRDDWRPYYAMQKRKSTARTVATLLVRCKNVTRRIKVYSMNSGDRIDAMQRGRTPLGGSQPEDRRPRCAMQKGHSSATASTACWNQGCDALLRLLSTLKEPALARCFSFLLNLICSFSITFSQAYFHSQPKAKTVVMATKYEWLTTKRDGQTKKPLDYVLSPVLSDKVRRPAYNSTVQGVQVKREDHLWTLYQVLRKLSCSKMATVAALNQALLVNHLFRQEYLNCVLQYVVALAELKASDYEGNAIAITDFPEGTALLEAKLQARTKLRDICTRYRVTLIESN